MVDMFGFQPFQNSILIKCGLAVEMAQILGSCNCAFYLFPHKVMKKIQVRGDEVSYDNTLFRKSRRHSAGSGSTNYCEFFKTSDLQEWMLLREHYGSYLEKCKQMESFKSCFIMMLMQ